jgi:hypothetical protein
MSGLNQNWNMLTNCIKPSNKKFKDHSFVVLSLLCAKELSEIQTDKKGVFTTSSWEHAEHEIWDA